MTDDAPLIRHGWVEAFGRWYKSHAFLNPADAATRGIAAGGVARVYNNRGSFDAAADISADTWAGIVVAPMGCWARRDGNGRTANAVNFPAFADYGHAPTFSDTLVEVARHAGAD